MAATRLVYRKWRKGRTGVHPVEALSSWASVDAVALNGTHEDDLRIKLASQA